MVTRPGHPLVLRHPLVLKHLLVLRHPLVLHTQQTCTPTRPSSGGLAVAGQEVGPTGAHHIHQGWIRGGLSEAGALGPPLNDRDVGWVQDGRPGQVEGRQGGPREDQDLGLLHKAPKAHWPSPERGHTPGQACGDRVPCVVWRRGQSPGGWRVSSSPSPGPPQEAPQKAPQKAPSPASPSPTPGTQAAQAPVQKGALSPRALGQPQSLQATSPGSPHPTGPSYPLPAPAPPPGPMSTGLGTGGGWRAGDGPWVPWDAPLVSAPPRSGSCSEALGAHSTESLGTLKWGCMAFLLHH